MAEKKSSTEKQPEAEHSGTPSSIAAAAAEKAPDDEKAAVYEAAKRKARWG